MTDKRKFMQADNEDDLMILNDYQKIADAKKFHYLSYLERYFTKYYMLDVRTPLSDHLIMLHSNKVAVCALAPSHPVLDAAKYKIARVEFIQQVNEEMRGKHKHFANNVNVNQPICKIFCDVIASDTAETTETPAEKTTFVICSCLNAKLIETNERLLKNPELLQTKPDTEGYIGILMPKLESIREQMLVFKTHAEFVKIRMSDKIAPG
jgi:hypothetical protein